MTREHRENLAKAAKQLANKAKEALRRVRSSAVSQAKRAKEGHSEDTVRLVERQVGVLAASCASAPLRGEGPGLQPSFYFLSLRFSSSPTTWPQTWTSCWPPR